VPNPGLIKHKDIKIGGLFRFLAVITVKSRFSFRFLPRMCPAVCVCALCCPLCGEVDAVSLQKKGLGLLVCLDLKKIQMGLILAFQK
jgi:hypothetical protein